MKSIIAFCCLATLTVWAQETPLRLRPVELADPWGGPGMVKQRSTGRGMMISEDFESGNLGAWLLSDQAGGAYTWAVTGCDAANGLRSADGIRGGTAGQYLDCGAAYPQLAQTGLVWAQELDFSGTGAAWLDLEASVDLNLQDLDGGLFVGWRLGAEGGFHRLAIADAGGLWRRYRFNLRQLYHWQDLVMAGEPGRLGFFFLSGATPADGFGARLDNIQVAIGAITGQTCAILGPATGLAGRALQFQAQCDGASGSLYQEWQFDDGTVETGPATTHGFAEPGAHWVRLLSWDELRVCVCDWRVTVADPYDLNNDGEVNAEDLTLAAATLCENEPQVPDAWADIDGDGRVSVMDLQELARALARVR